MSCQPSLLPTMTSLGRGTGLPLQPKSPPPPHLLQAKVTLMPQPPKEPPPQHVLAARDIAFANIAKTLGIPQRTRVFGCAVADAAVIDYLAALSEEAAAEVVRQAAEQRGVLVDGLVYIQPPGRMAPGGGILSLPFHSARRARSRCKAWYGCVGYQQRVGRWADERLRVTADHRLRVHWPGGGDIQPDRWTCGSWWTGPLEDAVSRTS